MTRIRYAGVVNRSPVPGGGNPFHAIETCVSVHEGEPVVSLVVRTHDRRTAKELDDVGGMGMSLDEARGVHAALGEAIRAAEMAARRSTD